MNELQQVLLIFAILVIAGLYLLNKAKSKKNPSRPSGKTDNVAVETKQSQGLNDMGEPHLPLSEKTRHRLNVDEIAEDESVPDAQLGLFFGQEFDIKKTADRQSDHPLSSVEQERRKPEEILIKSDDEIEPELPKAFDRETITERSPKTQEKVTSPAEEKIFALIIMGSDDFLWPKVNQTLQGVGLLPAKSGIFIKNDTMENELIRVANILEPGTFPLEEPINSEYKIAGLVLIVTLPTSVPASSVMNEMILMARKISQRLNGRLYDVERHLIKESDLQAMCDAAAEYDNVS